MSFANGFSRPTLGSQRRELFEAESTARKTKHAVALAYSSRRSGHIGIIEVIASVVTVVAVTRGRRIFFFCVHNSDLTRHDLQKS